MSLSTIPASRLIAGTSLALTLLLGGAACSSDSPTATAGDPPTSQGSPADTSSGSTNRIEGACDAYVEVSGIFMADPSQAPEVLDEFVTALPADLSGAGQVVADGLEAMMTSEEPAPPSPEYAVASTQIGDAMYERCQSDAKLDIAGIDYGFEGLPDEVAAGRVAIRFTNETAAAEAHELFLLKRVAGDTTPAMDLLMLDEEEMMAKAQPVGVVFADEKDGVATSLMELQPGEYIAVCNIPVGGGETGSPHAMEGMLAEFTVA